MNRCETCAGTCPTCRAGESCTLCAALSRRSRGERPTTAVLAAARGTARPAAPCCAACAGHGEGDAALAKMKAEFARQKTALAARGVKTFAQFVELERKIDAAFVAGSRARAAASDPVTLAPPDEGDLGALPVGCCQYPDGGTEENVGRHYCERKGGVWSKGESCEQAADNPVRPPGESAKAISDAAFVAGIRASEEQQQLRRRAKLLEMRARKAAGRWR